MPNPSARAHIVTRPALLATILVLVTGALLWIRGAPLFLGWQVARDHDRCTWRARPLVRLSTNDPLAAREWLEARGTPVPPLPEGVDGLTLIGVRYCPLADRIAAHLFYDGERGRISVFVLAGPGRIGDGWAGEYGDLNVRLLRSAGRTLAIVGSSGPDVEALTRAFRSSIA